MKTLFVCIFTSLFFLATPMTYAAMAGDPESFVDHFPAGLTYEQTTELGMNANLDLIAAKYNIDLAKADELTAGLWNNPSILFDTVFEPFGENWNQTTTGGPRQFDLILSYPLDLSGKRSAAMKSAHAASDVAEASFQDTFRQKVLQVRLAYIDLLVAGYQLSLSKERQESMHHLVSMIENRIGNKGRLPLLQRRARLALDQAVLDTRQRETALRSSKTALAILLNRPPIETSVDAVSKLRDINLIPLPPEGGLEKDAESLRPDLKALRLTVTKTNADSDLAHAQVWDNFVVTAGVSRQGSASPNPNDANSVSIPGAYSWNAGLTIPFPVFNRNQGAIQKASTTRDQAERQIQALLLSIHQEVYSDYDQIKLNEGLIRDYEANQLDNARRVRDSQQTLFGTGGSALLDYFDAVSAYQTSLSSYYDVVAEYRRGLARLNAAIGKDVLK
jgi:cobalt-zinc-cadmium efflux system outer membrane protein